MRSHSDSLIPGVFPALDFCLAHLGLEGKVRKLSCPIVALLPERPCQVQQTGIPRVVVEPEHAQDFVGPAVFRPFVKRAFAEVGGLKVEVPVHERDHSWVSGGFLVLGERLQHHHVWPPILVLFRTDRTIRPLVSQRPVHPLVRFGNQPGVAKKIGQWDQTVGVVGAALPAFPGTSQPAAIGA